MLPRSSVFSTSAQLKAHIFANSFCPFSAQMTLKGDKTTDIAYIAARCTANKKNITASNFLDALLAVGGYRPKNSQVFQKYGDTTNIVSEIARMVTMDSNFVLKISGFSSMKPIRKENEITYEGAAEFVRILEDWQMGPGRDEVWSGTLKEHWPLHCAREVRGNQ
jgi:hypothetical protein